MQLMQTLIRAKTRTLSEPLRGLLFIFLQTLSSIFGVFHHPFFPFLQNSNFPHRSPLCRFPKFNNSNYTTDLVWTKLFQDECELWHFERCIQTLPFYKAAVLKLGYNPQWRRWSWVWGSWHHWQHKKVRRFLHHFSLYSSVLTICSSIRNSKFKTFWPSVALGSPWFRIAALNGNLKTNMLIANDRVLSTPTILSRVTLSHTLQSSDATTWKTPRSSVCRHVAFFAYPSRYRTNRSGFVPLTPL